MVTSIFFLLLLSALGVIVSERRSRNAAELQRHYLESILLGGQEGERYLDQLSRLSNGTAKWVAAEVIASLSPIIYRMDEEQLLRISYSLHLPEFLLSRAAGSRGLKRARAIMLLSHIPSPHITLQRLSNFKIDENRMVRFYTLLASIALDKVNMLRHIATYSSPLTPYELSQLISLLRRGSIAVAYQPLLRSENVNLNLLGLSVVREFGIEGAEQDLRRMVECCPNDELRQQALYTLASMQLSISSDSICHYLRRISQKDRLRFLRYATSQGYSQGVIDNLTSHFEREYFHSLIDSYKIKIGCY